VTVTNPTTSAMNGWTAGWTVAEGETVTSSWNGSLTQAGSLATVVAAGWNSHLAAGGTTNFGFTATYNGTPPVPTSVSCQSP